MPPDEVDDEPLECGYCYAENDATAIECWKCDEILNN